MRTYYTGLCVRFVVVMGLRLMLTIGVTAQTYTKVYDFSFDGSEPEGGVILSGDTLYGTTTFGDPSDDGTVFRVNIDGTAFANLYNFTAVSYVGNGIGTNGDGANPSDSLVQSGNTLYGTAESGGTFGYGTVFAINTDGTDFRTLHSFDNSDGAEPKAALILSGNTLYGTTYSGGNSGYGTVFAVNANGSGFTNLFNFNGSDREGGAPWGGLLLLGKTLYGTTSGSDTSSSGNVFAICTNGMGFTNLHCFNGVTDGNVPYATLVSSGRTLYGTTEFGGPGGEGTVFAVNTDGTGFTNLYIFDGQGTDGDSPYAGLALWGQTLFGTTKETGNNALGTVFAINTDGSGFTYLHHFAGFPNEGSTPENGLIFSNNTLYGTAYTGGGFDAGTVFSISVPVPPQPIITLQGPVFILAWPTNSGNFVLESCTNIAPPVTWNAVSPGPTVVNGQNVVTNSISGKQMFFRLSL